MRPAPTNVPALKHSNSNLPRPLQFMATSHENPLTAHSPSRRNGVKAPVAWLRSTGARKQTKMNPLIGELPDISVRHGKKARTLLMVTTKRIHRNEENRSQISTPTLKSTPPHPSSRKRGLSVYQNECLQHYHRGTLEERCHRSWIVSRQQKVLSRSR